MAQNTAGPLDRDTMLPYKTPGLANSVNFAQQQTQTTAPRTDKSTSTVTDKTVQAVSSASQQVNTTPGALAALEQLISTLTDRPNIDAAQLEAQFPMANRVFSPQFGWYYTNPATGMAMSAAEAQSYNKQQEAKRAQATAAAGTTPGGTAAQKAQQGERQTEIQRNRATQAGYTKDAAMGDANALIQKSIADALEAAMPQISAQLEGAGTSKSTLGANLTQKAALKGATEGAALGAQLSSSYGQINNQLAGVLEMLTRSDPNSPEAMLLQAIIGSKGLISTATQQQSQVGTSTKVGETVTNTGQNTVNTDTTRSPLGQPAAALPGVPQLAASVVKANPINNQYVFAQRDNGIAPPIMVTTSNSGGVFDTGTSAEALYSVGEDEE